MPVPELHMPPNYNDITNAENGLVGREGGEDRRSPRRLGVQIPFCEKLCTILIERKADRILDHTIMTIGMCGVLAALVAYGWYKLSIHRGEQERKTFRFHMFQNGWDAVQGVLVNFILVWLVLLWRSELLLRSWGRKTIFVVYASVIYFWTAAIMAGLRDFNKEE